MAFLGHFYGGKPTDWYDVPLDEVFLWYEEAVKLHKKMNPPPSG